MARATKAAKAPAKKTTGKALIPFEERLRQQAQVATAIEENVGSGGQMIGTRGGRLSFGGAEVPGNKMNVIIIDHVLENHLYEGRFDPDTPQSPICFAFGRSEPEMSPHENSAEPQHDMCKGCPMNEWGSADTGSGKACKNVRRLALITEDQLDDVESAQVAYLKVPVTSVKGWAGYVRQLANTLERPPLGVITEISLVPDPKSQFKMQFKLVEAIDDGDVLEALFNKQETVATEIEFPYAPPGEEDEKPARGKGRGRGHAKPEPRGRAQRATREERPARAERDSNPPGRPGRGGTAAKPAAKRKY